MGRSAQDSKQRVSPSTGMQSDSKLFSILLLFRCLNALLLATEFVPDEFWQSTEPAHKMAFGYGSLTWEWQSEIALRSPLYPAFIAALYRVTVGLFGNNNDVSQHLLIVTVPRLAHALLAALVDLTLFQLTRRLAGPRVAKWTLIHQLTNWFTLFTATRTLTNSIEWALTPIALSLYPPLLLRASSTLPFALLAVGTTLLRPTAGLLWIVLSLGHIVWCWWRTEEVGEKRSSRFSSPLTVYLLTSLALASLSLLADRLFYGYWTCNQLNFAIFNLGGASATYGTHPWHWYASQGLPAMLASQLPLFLAGLYLTVARRKRKNADLLLSACLVWVITCYSLLGHKEFRFIFQLLPIAAYFAGLATVAMLDWVALDNNNKKKNDDVTSKSRLSLLVRVCLLLLLALQLLIAAYTSVWHQRGGLDALNWLARQIEPTERTTILATMPCHSLPSIG